VSGHLQFLIILYVKKGNVACSSSWNSPQNYGTPLVNGIRQCYLPPDRADRPAFWPRYVLFCIIMSIVFVKFTKIQYLQSCLCRKFHLFLRKSTKKLLPPELLLLAQICTKLFVGCGFASDPTGWAYIAPPDP